MTQFASICLFLNATIIRHNLDQLNYAATTIEQYMHNRGGHCLFLDTSGGQYKYDSFMNEILLRPEMASVPRISLNGYFKGPDVGGLFPSLMLVQGNAKMLPSYSFVQKIFHHKIDHHTRTVLFSPTKGFPKDLKLNHKMLLEGKIFNLAVISTDEKRVLYLKWMTDRHQDLPYPPEIKELFHYQLKDSAGYDFVYSLRKRQLVIYRNWSAPIGPMVCWADDTARYLNGSSTYKPHLCHRYSKTWSACFRSFLIKSKITYSLDGIVLEDKERKFYWRMLPLSIPKSIALLVPEPELLNKQHLFAMTLDIRSVSLILALIIITELIVMFMPVFTFGDALLYGICGTLPSDMNFAKRTEKIILKALMVTILVISYEFKAHLEAVTVHRPFENSTLESVDQLLATDIKIICDYLQNPEMRTDGRFNAHILHENDLPVRLDGRHAYFVDSELAPLLMGLKINYDHRYGRRRYRLLRESFSGNVQHRVVFPMNPFLKKFAYTERVFFESGIWQHWNEEHRWTIDQEMWEGFGGKEETSDAVESLTVVDLSVAWVTLAVGVSLGVLVLVMEKMVHYCFEFQA